MCFHDLVTNCSEGDDGAENTQERVQADIKKAVKRKLDVDLTDSDNMLRSPKETVDMARNLAILQSVNTPKAPSLGEFMEYEPLQPETQHEHMD